MEASTEYSTDQPIVLTGELFARIGKVLSARFGKPSTDGRCADDIVRTFNDIKQVVHYDNSRKSRLIAATVTARSDDYKEEVNIFFGSGSRNAGFRIVGPEQTVVKVRNELLEIIDAAKAWYWPVYSMRFIALAWLLIIILCLFYLYRITGHQLSRIAELPINGSLMIGAAIGWTVPTVLGVILSVLRYRLFPPLVFAVGQEKARFGVGEKVRWTIIVGFVVSLMASIVVALMS